jgi:hypothetical protein
VEPDGGLVLPGVKIGARGVVRQSAAIEVPLGTASDGTVWSLGADDASVRLHTARGAVHDVSLSKGAVPLYPTAFTVSGDSRLWFVADEHRFEPASIDWARSEPVVGSIDRSGTVSFAQLPAWTAALATFDGPLITAASDGAVWVAESGETSEGGIQRIVRIAPGSASEGGER